MQKYEIVIDGAAEGDFGSQELADAAATEARHKPGNENKQVIARPKAMTDEEKGQIANPAVAPPVAPLAAAPGIVVATPGSPTTSTSSPSTAPPKVQTGKKDEQR